MLQSARALYLGRVQPEPSVRCARVSADAERHVGIILVVDFSRGRRSASLEMGAGAVGGKREVVWREGAEAPQRRMYARENRGKARMRTGCISVGAGGIRGLEAAEAGGAG